MGSVSPVSTTLGTGPLRLTSCWAGRLTEPPAIFTADAVPGALIEISRSPSRAYRERKTPARPPATPAPLDVVSSTNRLAIETPARVLLAVKLGGWYCSVGALR